MIGLVRKLASLKLTLFGIAATILVTLVAYRSNQVGTACVALPLFLLTVNLLAALLTSDVFRRQPALLVFHVCLLAIIVLLGANVLMRFDGHVELFEGEGFTPGSVQIEDKGFWHRLEMDDISFEQGPIQVEYLPGLIRQRTSSEILKSTPQAKHRSILLGDRTSHEFNGYRFATSFNKGFALIITWIGDDGSNIRGAINFPSYPEYEWKQLNSWTTPVGEEIEIELHIADTIASGKRWTLQSAGKRFSGTVRSDANGLVTLQPGQAARVQNGSIRVEELRLWMGYRIDFQPFLPWVFASAMLALVALAIHFQFKFRPLTGVSVGALEDSGLAYDKRN